MEEKKSNVIPIAGAKTPGDAVILNPAGQVAISDAEIENAKVKALNELADSAIKRQFTDDKVGQIVAGVKQNIEEAVQKNTPQNMFNGVMQYLSMTLDLARPYFPPGIELAFVGYVPEGETEAKDGTVVSVTHTQNLMRLQSAVKQLVEFQKAEAIRRQIYVPE